MSTLEKAIAIAAEAHAGQIDKAGQPYILHPLRVMLLLTALEDRVVGVLHDVVEDGGEACSLDRLREEGFSETILAAIDSITKRPEEEDDYDAFIRRAAKHPVGRRVKLADLEDNCDLSRISAPTERDYRRIEKYRRAIEFLSCSEGEVGKFPMSTADRVPSKVEMVVMVDGRFPERSVTFSDGSGTTEFWDAGSKSWKLGGDPGAICHNPLLSEDSALAKEIGAFDPLTSPFAPKG
jgi:hypothetical protein